MDFKEGIDNLNNYYDVKLKEARLDRLLLSENFKFLKLDLENMQGLEKVFSENFIHKTIHLAAQAGVRYSLQNPNVYINSNVNGSRTY